MQDDDEFIEESLNDGDQMMMSEEEKEQVRMVAIEESQEFSVHDA